MAVVISVILIMFIMLAAVTLPLSADVQSSIRLGKIADERQLAESVMNELFSQAAKFSDLNSRFHMIGRVDPSAPLPAPARSVDDAGPTAGWAKYVPGTGSFQACDSITELCFFYSPQVTSGSPFVTVEVTTRSACRADGKSCVFRRFQQTWRRRTFVDYVIFTDMETLQPELYGSGGTALIVRRGAEAPVPVDTTWAQAHCGNRMTDNGDPYPFTTWPAVAGPLRDGYPDNSRRQTSNAVSSANERYLWPHRAGNNPLVPTTPSDEAPGLDQTNQPSDRRSENCFDIAYTGVTGDIDKITGPIHTNDYWFWYCGFPEFSDKIEATGDPDTSVTGLDAIFKRSTMSGCAASDPPKAAGGGVLTNYSRGPFLKLPDKLNNYADIAAKQDTFTPDPGTSVVKILVNGTTMKVTTDGSPASGSPIDLPVPYRGVVRVAARTLPADPPNRLEIEGTGSDVTFVSEDDLTVTGDIKQPLGTAGVTLGFVAGGSITINQTLRTDVPRKDRFVTGAFLSLKGMSVQEWNLPADAALITHPTLHLTGAIIAKYRPVFGTYDSTGKLQSGMRKDISYPTDSTLTKIPPTPPYFVQPVNAVWVRLDFSETPLLAGSPGLTLAPTSPPSGSGGLCTYAATWPNGDANGYVPSCLLN
jgi:hypothetical protein